MFKINDYKNKIDNFLEIMIQNKEIASVKLAEDKWTLKEMISHLIDSASNNHQRFVRLQCNKTLDFPAYDAEVWRDITKIGSFDFTELLNLWKSYNYFLLHLIENIDESKLNNVWKINREELTLKFLIEDYFGRHLDWHIELYKKRIAEIRQEQNALN